MGADSPPPAQSTGTTLLEFIAAFPNLLRSVNSMNPETVTSQLSGVNRMLNPGSNQVLGLNDLNLQQAQRYAEPMAAVQRGVASGNAATGAELMDRFSPAYAGSKNLLGAINLKGLSPGEAASVERSLNQTNTSTGNLGLVNPTNTISNAINFGGAFNNKVNLYNDAVKTATGAMGGFNPAGTTFGGDSLVGSNFNSANQASSNATNFAGNVLGGMFGSNNSLIASATSRANQESIPSYLNSTLGNL